MKPILPYPSEQASIINELIKSTSFERNTPAFIISLDWFTYFLKYVGLIQNDENLDKKPGKIKNQCLLFQNKIKFCAKLHKDFEVVTKSVWDTVFEWYGGGPEIKVRIAYDQENNIYQPILFDRKVNVSYQNNVSQFSYNEFTLISNFKKKVCYYFNIDPNNHSLFDQVNGHNIAKLDDNYKLSQFVILETCPLVLKSNKDKTDITSVPNFSSAFEWSKYERAPVMFESRFARGLRNTGNNCYQNAVIQCLLHTENFVNAFKSEGFSAPGPISLAFQNLIKKYFSESNGCPIDLESLLNAVNSKTSRFRGRRQEDSHEFLMVLLSLMNDEFSNPKFMIENRCESEKDEEFANDYWNKYLDHFNNPVVRNFYGLLKSKLSCPCCKSTYSSYEPFSTLPLSLPNPIRVSKQITFIPFDVSEPQSIVRLPLSLFSTADDITNEISKLMGRYLVIAYAEETDNIQWTKEPHPFDSSSKLYAFEIDNKTEEKKKYSLVSLKAIQKAFHNGIECVIGHPYLIELPNEIKADEFIIHNRNKIAEVLTQKCEERFSVLFCPEKAIEPDDFIMTLSKSSERYLSNSNIKVTRSKSAIKSPYDFISTTKINILVKPEIVSNPQKFNWRLLYSKNRIHMKPELERCELSRCINCFKSAEFLDNRNKWLCPSCNQKVNANKKLDIWFAPKYLIIQLKRFKREEDKDNKCQKLSTNVIFPDVCGLSSVASNFQEEDRKYSLYGVCDHEGGISGGHYTSHVKCKTDSGKKWCLFNDNLVRESAKKSVHSASAYMLFYEMKS